MTYFPTELGIYHGAIRLRPAGHQLKSAKSAGQQCHGNVYVSYVANIEPSPDPMYGTNCLSWHPKIPELGVLTRGMEKQRWPNLLPFRRMRKEGNKDTPALDCEESWKILSAAKEGCET